MKRFQMITEADARVLEYGSSVVLVPGGHVTRWRRTTLSARRVSIVREGHDADAASLAPRAEILRGGACGRSYRRPAEGGDPPAPARTGSCGARPRHGPQRSGGLPGRGGKRRAAGLGGEADAGIVIDGAGLGSTIAANKIRGVRAAMCLNQRFARYARQHNGANVWRWGDTGHR